MSKSKKQTTLDTEDAPFVPSVEERLSDARGKAALLAQYGLLGELKTEERPPTRMFWRGLGSLAEALEAYLIAVRMALDADALTTDAPAVEVPDRLT